MSIRKNFALKSAFLLTLTSLLLWSSSAMAGAPIRQGGNFGIGVGGGYGVTGLSMKYFMTPGTAVQSTIGIHTGYRFDYIGATFDYLIEIPEFVQSDVVNIGPSIGPGVALGLWDNGLAVGVSGVGGIEFMLNPVPLDFVLEWRPTVHVVPDVNLDLVRFTGHIRFYF